MRSFDEVEKIAAIAIVNGVSNEHLPEHSSKEKEEKWVEDERDKFAELRSHDASKIAYEFQKSTLTIMRRLLIAAVIVVRKSAEKWWECLLVLAAGAALIKPMVRISGNVWYLPPSLWSGPTEHTFSPA